MKEIAAYLNFNGNCREAMTFYKKCMGAELHLVPFSDMPGNHPPGMKDGIMHARLTKGPASVLMASDTMPGSFQQGNNISIAIQCESIAEIDALFGAMGENGKVTQPLADAPWGARFGMLTDQFGIHWLFDCDLPKQG